MHETELLETGGHFGIVWSMQIQRYPQTGLQILESDDVTVPFP